MEYNYKMLLKNTIYYKKKAVPIEKIYEDGLFSQLHDAHATL